jgi:hypothetical protein
VGSKKTKNPIEFNQITYYHAPQLYLTATADAANESMMTKDIVENFFSQ